MQTPGGVQAGRQVRWTLAEPRRTRPPPTRWRRVRGCCRRWQRSPRMLGRWAERVRSPRRSPRSRATGARVCRHRHRTEVQEVQKAQEVKEVQGAPGELVMPAGPGMQVGTAKARRNGRS